MNRKRMALAVAGIFALPGVALAQKSTVEIYGRANLGLDYYEAKGATNPYENRQGRWRVFDNSSRVGFRGTEDLGSGLRAVFQIETGVNVDNGSNTGQAGANNGSTGFWASRDSFVGLDSGYGRLTLGRQSLYYQNGVNAQFSSNYINTEVPWTDGRQLGRISTGVAISRTSNVVQYTSPTFAGMNATLSYSPNAQEAVQAVGAGVDTDGAIYGATVRGTWGPFYVQGDVGWNYANTVVTTNTQQKATLYKLGGSWGYMPGSRVGLIWVRTDTNNQGGLVPGLAAGDDVYQDGFVINWEQTFGNVQVMAQYGWTGDIKDCNAATATVSCNDSDSNGFMVGARYFLSKRTWVYASYNQVSNKANQFADYTGSSITSTTGLTAAGPNPFGADPKIWALGLFHAF
ncbi:MAG: porin [Vicinamibacterales bacterium]